MGLFDQLAGGLMSSLAGQQKNDLASGLLSLLASQPGGLSGLLQLFTSKGIGNIAQSWISPGQNLPISAEQLHSVFGNDQLQQLAQQAGIAPEHAGSAISQMLPQIVDQLTPQGNIPQQGDLMSMGLSLLKGKLFG
jgi:uncharacterized protein YidB (DUF937 family)